MIYGRLRHWRMIPPPVFGTIGPSQVPPLVTDDQITPPSDFLEPYTLWLTGIYFAELVQKPYPQVIFSWSYDGNGNRVAATPTMYAFNQNTIQLDNPPDVLYNYALLYYQQPALLSGTNLTNFLTTYYPRLVRVATMLEATEWVKEVGTGQFDRSYWMQQFEEEIGKAQEQSDRAKRATVAGFVDIGGGGSGGFPVLGW